MLFGHGELAVSVFTKLNSEGISVLSVVDSEGENGQLLSYSRECNIPVTSVHPRKDEERLFAFLKESAATATVLLSVNFRYIVGKSILNRFRWPLNIHGSLLPKYRGRTPHVWAIINGETETGATLHVMDEGVDTGPIVAQKSITIGPYDTGATILERFNKLYPELVVEGLQRIMNGGHLIEQNDANATFFGRRTPEMGLVDFRMPYEKLHNFVRAIAPPYPGAYCYLTDGKRIVVEKITLRNDLAMLGLPKYSPRVVADMILVRNDDGVIQLHEAKG